MDETARLINDRANHLYQKLQIIDISHTNIDDFGKAYFNSHHIGKRLFFSIQSSADIIYRSTRMINKPIADISFIDYGAGLGTLFLLAGMVGFKKVYFNDYFPQWATYANIISDQLSITIDDYISGDIDAVIDYGKKHDIHFDIVASRNVVEHIYSLSSFYSKLYNSNLVTVCYSTTTANYYNPAMRIKHYLYHKNAEKSQFIKQRSEYISQLVPGISVSDLKTLVEITRGRAFDDFTTAVNHYIQRKPVPPVAFLSTNTCDCKTGVWAENLITGQQYKEIIEGAGFRMLISPGFWDTHYRYLLMNMITRILNRLINISGKKGYLFSPFINIVAAK